MTKRELLERIEKIETLVGKDSVDKVTFPWSCFVAFGGDGTILERISSLNERFDEITERITELEGYLKIERFSESKKGYRKSVSKK